MKKVSYLILVLILLACGVLIASQARPSQAASNQILEFNTMVGVPRPYTGAANAIRGVPGGGFPWVLKAANGELSSSGKLEIRVTGLVIDPTDPAAITAGVAGKNPATTFKAIVSCLSKDANGNANVVNLTSAAFPASAVGNSRIETSLTLPNPCIAPIIFVTSPAGAWFAATGN